MASLQDRFHALLSERPDITKADIARATGVKPPSVSDWFSGKTKTLKAETALKAAALYKCNPNWLASGIGPKYITQMGDSQTSHLVGNIHSENISEIPDRKQVPLISWVRAGSWAEIQDPFHPGEADEWVTPVNSKPNGRAYALRVTGDSMTNPNQSGHSFPEGTIIVVDPDMGYGAGNFVIAKDVKTQKATFKQLTTDGGRWFLKPLNPIYSIIEIDDPSIWVIGRVCEFIRPGGKL